MAKPKEARNRLFQENWQKGMSNEALAQKFNLSTGGVKALKQRLREKHHSLYQKKVVGKPATQQASKVAEYEKVSYYLDPGMAKQIKQLALNQDMDISELIREIVREYVKKKGGDSR